MIRLYERHLAIEDHGFLRQSLSILSAFVRMSTFIIFLTFKVSGQLQRFFDVNHDGCLVCFPGDKILQICVSNRMQETPIKAILNTMLEILSLAAAYNHAGRKLKAV